MTLHQTYCFLSNNFTFLVILPQVTAIYFTFGDLFLVAMVTARVKMTILVSTTDVLSFQVKLCLKVLVEKIFIFFVQDHLKPEMHFLSKLGGGLVTTEQFLSFLSKFDQKMTSYG